MYRTTARVLPALAALLALAACAAAASPAPPPKPASATAALVPPAATTAPMAAAAPATPPPTAPPARVAINMPYAGRGVAGLAHYTAVEDGLYARHGIDVTSANIGNPATLVAAVL